MTKRLKLLAKRLLSYIPTPIPVGMTAYNQWLNDIIELSGPFADADSLKWTICNEVMRLAPGRSAIPKNSIVRILRKFAANQLAAATVNEIKARHEAAQLAAVEAQKQAAATAVSETATESVKTT
jgi:hypothetical protein